MPTRKSLHPSKWKEVTNRNFLSVVGFKFALERCPKVDFYCNSFKSFQKMDAKGFNPSAKDSPQGEEAAETAAAKPTFDEESVKDDVVFF